MSKSLEEMKAAYEALEREYVHLKARFREIDKKNQYLEATLRNSANYGLEPRRMIKDPE
jgi:hypothetical protein